MDGFQKSIKSKMESFSPWPLNVGVPQNLVLGRLPTACFFPGGPPLVHGPSKALLCWWLPQNPAAQTSGHHTLSLSPGLHPPGAVTRDTSDFKGRKCQALTPPHPQTSPPHHLALRATTHTQLFETLLGHKLEFWKLIGLFIVCVWNLPCCPSFYLHLALGTWGLFTLESQTLRGGGNDLELFHGCLPPLRSRLSGTSRTLDLPDPSSAFHFFIFFSVHGKIPQLYLCILLSSFLFLLSCFLVSSQLLLYLGCQLCEGKVSVQRRSPWHLQRLAHHLSQGRCSVITL